MREIARAATVVGTPAAATSREICPTPGDRQRDPLPRQGVHKSGRPDLNRGPPPPKGGALPGCATPRSRAESRPSTRTPCPSRPGAAPAAACREPPRPRPRAHSATFWFEAGCYWSSGESGSRAARLRASQTRMPAGRRRPGPRVLNPNRRDPAREPVQPAGRHRNHGGIGVRKRCRVPAALVTPGSQVSRVGHV